MYLQYKLSKLFFPSVICSINAKNIYLTFDDGPHPEATQTTLDILIKYNIKATFFLSGESGEKHLSVIKQLYNCGHEIGNHAYSHTSLIYKRKHFIRNEIIKTNEIIKSAVGVYPKLFRPPYGYINWNIGNVLNELKMTCVLWNVDSRDFGLSTEKIRKLVLKRTTQGSIILFHTNEYTYKKINVYLPIIIESLLENDFTFDAIRL